MADVAGIGIACGNCLVGVFYQWWYTKRYGADGLPGSETHWKCLALDCGFEETGEADSIYRHYAAASEKDWQAYLRGTPLPRAAPVVRPPSRVPTPGPQPGGQRERPPIIAWPTEVRPALAFFGKMQEEVGGKVKKGGEIMMREMDVAKKIRDVEGREGPERQEGPSNILATEERPAVQEQSSPQRPEDVPSPRPAPDPPVTPLPTVRVEPPEDIRLSGETVSDSRWSTDMHTAPESPEPGEPDEDTRPLTPASDEPSSLASPSPQPAGWRLPLPLPGFLQTAGQQAQQVPGRLRPALQVLNPARMARPASVVSFEEETDPGVYMKLAER